MAFTLAVTDNDAHSATVSKQVIGRAGEAGEVITVTVSATLTALGYPAYMHFLLPDGSSVYKGPYAIVANTFNVTIGATDNVLAYEGNLVIQLVLQSGTTTIWKSEEKTVRINGSVNAGLPATPDARIWVEIPTTFVAGNVAGYNPTTGKLTDLGVKGSTVTEQWANVKDYGAVGDGVTDDSTAFNAAVTACTHIAISSGTYYIKDVVATTKTDVHFQGMGAVTIKPHKQTNHNNLIEYCFNISGATNVSFKNINFLSDDAITETGVMDHFTKSAILLENVANVLVESCTFKHIYAIDHGTTPLLWEDRRGLAITTIDCYNVYVDKCEFDNLQGDEWNWHCVDTHAFGEDNIRITNCTFHNSVSALAAASSNSAYGICSADVLFDNNSIYDYVYAGSAVNMLGRNVTVTNNRVYDCTFRSVFDTTESGYCHNELVTMYNNYIDNPQGLRGIYLSSYKADVYDNFISAFQPMYFRNRYFGDKDYLVEYADMKNGAYTIVSGHGTPAYTTGGVISVTTVSTSTADTLGIITVVGTRAGAAQTEVITPVAGATVYGLKFFDTVTSVTGSGWTVADGADKIVCGYKYVKYYNSTLYPNCDIINIHDNTFVRDADDNVNIGTIPTEGMIFFYILASTYTLAAATAVPVVTDTITFRNNLVLHEYDTIDNVPMVVDLIVNHMLIENNVFSGIGASDGTVYTNFIRLYKFTSIYTTTNNTIIHGNIFENRAAQIVTALNAVAIASGVDANPGDPYYGGVLPLVDMIGNICRIGSAAVATSFNLAAGLTDNNTNFV